MTLTLSEMLQAATKSAKSQTPTYKNVRKAKKAKAKAKLSPPKRKRRKQSAKAKAAAKVQKVMEASHRIDLSGNPIIPYAQKPVNSVCLRCKNSCKQTTDVLLIACPTYDPIKPRKNAKKEEEVA